MMELREQIAREIGTGWFTDDGRPPLINNYPDQHLSYQARAYETADRILAIPEIAEALEVAKRAGELPRGKEVW